QRADRLPPYRSSLAGLLLEAREAVMQPFRPILRSAGVTDQQWRVLRMLIDRGPIDLAQLAEAALLHPPSLTRILRDLVARKLVRRAKNPKDGRGTLVSISPTGQELVRRLTAEALPVHEKVAARYGKARLNQLQSELAALALVLQGD